MTKILITCLEKSGGTALYHKVLKSFPGKISGIFEPKMLGDLNSESLLVKTNIVNVKQCFQKWDKKILLVRDPRDLIISAMLFNSYSLYDKEDQFRAFRSLLLKKEYDPKSTPVTRLQKAVGYVDPINFYSRLFDELIEFSKKKEYFIFKFEDMVLKNYVKLENYLGFKIKDVEIPEKHDIVVRKKEAGDWKNWFTSSDLYVYKEVINKYLEAFGYPVKWEKETNRIIMPEHASKYVTKIVNKRRLENKLFLLE